jgi:hypothetical protein
LNITSNTTTAGQTAPGDGICIANYDTYINGQNGANNVIVRYVRFRMGDLRAFEGHAIWGRNSRDIIIDHCSISWGTDDTASFYDNDNFTMQWCMISESLRTSVHTKGNHGYGGIWGGRKASFHHNLLAHHDSRNPRFCGSRYSALPDEELVDLRNNVIYNWGSNSGYGGEGGSFNIVNNYYKPGESSKYGYVTYLPLQIKSSRAENAKGYLRGNYFYNAPAEFNKDNYTAVTYTNTGDYNSTTRKSFEVFRPFVYGADRPITQNAEEAYQLVLKYAGASLFRDAVDHRMVKDVEQGTGRLIDSQKDVGGWPEYRSKPAPKDSDGDGIPDDWEIKHGLNPNDPSDGNRYTLDKDYTNLEVYLNSLVEHLYIK